MARWRDSFVLGGILALVALLVPAATLVQSAVRPARGETLFLAIGVATDTYEQTAKAHGGWPVGPQIARFGVLLTGPPPMAQALRQTGAWFVIPANGLSFLCTPVPELKSVS